jgi:Kdo2-lipid IVA lauroyltransferase/acyltransferase
MTDKTAPPPAMKPMQALRYRAEAAGFFTLMGLFRVLGLRPGSALGGFVGRAIFYRLPITDRARTNLRTSFPQMPDTDVETTLREMWDNLGRTIAEYAHLDRFSIKGADPRIMIAGLEHADAALASGKPVIFVSGHFANWEVLPIAAAQYGVDGGSVYRPLNNPFVDRWLVKQRAAYGPKEQITKSARGTRRIFTLLRAHKSIFLLVDQKTNEGLPVPFFGRDAMTTPTPAALALKLGAVLVPVSNERLGGARFRVTLHPPIAFEAGGDNERDVFALTTKINEAIETLVRLRPSQWLWIHRRWPKEGDRPRSRRGIEAQTLAGSGVRVDSDGSSAI